MTAVLLLLAWLPSLAGAEMRDVPSLPHPATIPTDTREVGIPLQLPVPELDRRPPPEAPAAAEEAVSRTFVVDMGGPEAEPAARAARQPAAAEIERAVADRDPSRLARLFDGDQRAAVKALAGLAAVAPIAHGRVESLLRVAEPLSVERIRDARGRTPPPGEKQQLFNTAVHDALALRPLTEPIAAEVSASLRRLASRAINDQESLAEKLIARFESRRRQAPR